MSRVVIIGGGAAGMMAAVSAADCGHQVTLLEKNEKLGKKVYITGKGRCNVTNQCDVEELLQNVKRNPKFLYSAFYTFDSGRVMDFFEEEGLLLKVERGNRVFPVSDKSSDVIRTLQNALKKRNVEIQYHTEAKKITTESKRVTGVILSDKRQIPADAVVVATGGVSYPGTGSTGDGYVFASETGHEVRKAYPSLVPFCVKENYIPKMQGLSLRNVVLRICQKDKTVFEEQGELLFTHFGISGPLVLSASSVLSGTHEKDSRGFIDLKPALSDLQLDERIIRDFKEFQNSYFKNSLQKLLPSKMIPVVVELSGISPEKKVNEITKEERSRLVKLVKSFPFTIEGFRGFQEAIITRGGVSVKDINPATMESKKIRGMYFAGEVVDLDALTGGYNLQIAWSTGYLAGLSIE